MEDVAPNIADASTQLPEDIEILRERLPWDEVAARARARLEGAAPELAPYIIDLDARVFGLSSGFFYLPAAQAAQWGVDDPEWFDGLTQLLAIGHAHFAIQDALVDAGQCAAEQVLLSDVCLLEYLNSLDRLSIEPPARYRAHHDLYYRWYLRALLIELKHRRYLHSYSAEEVSVLGLKAAPGNTVLHVIADAAGRPSDSGPLVRSVMQLCTGLQIIDDLNDMSVDLSDGNLTMPLTATLLRYEEQADLPLDDVPALAAAGGVTRACLMIAARYFDLAGKSAAEAGAGVAGELSVVWRQRVDRQLDRLASLLAEP